MIIETEEQEQKLADEYCGSDYFELDEKHMDALINGKKIGLVVLDEYTIFIEKKQLMPQTNEEANIRINKFMEDEKMERGRVNWFNDGKGFGFIEREGKHDIFVHFQNIKGTGHRTLLENQKVRFDVETTEKGENAINVEVIEE